MPTPPSTCVPRRPRRPASMLALIALLACVPSTSPAAGMPAESRPPELKVSVAVGPALPLGHAAERWVAGLNASAGAAAVAKLHPGATLAERDPARELLALADGRADLAVGSALQWSMQVPALAVFALPWIAPQDRELSALAGDASLREALARRLDAAGVALVALAPLGHREIATTTRATRAPDDLAGLRLRTAPLPLLQEVLAALGAAVQALPFARAQAAFAAGTLDGQEGPPTTLAASRAVAFGPKHMTVWGAFADAMVFGVRKAVWERWSDAQREAARSAAASAIRDTDALGREALAVTALARQGVAVLRLTPAGHAAFREAVRDVDARWREVVGRDVVEIAERAIAGAASRPPVSSTPPASSR